MKKILFALALLAFSPAARASEMVECTGCGTNDMKEYLALSQGSYRAYFDVAAGWVRSFQANGCNAEGTNWMWCVTEVTPWWSEQQIFGAMRALEQADPGFFAKDHEVRIPIDAIGGGDPVGISIYGRGGAPYAEFTRNVNNFLSNPGLVRQFDPGLASFLSDVTSRSYTYGVELKYVVWTTTSSEMPGPSWQINFCTGDNDCAHIQLNADKTWNFVESRDPWNHRYPSPDAASSGGFENGVVGDIHVSHIDRAFNGPINYQGSGTVVAYVTAVYVNGVLVSVTIVLQRE